MAAFRPLALATAIAVAATPSIADGLHWRQITAEEWLAAFTGYTMEGVYSDGVRFTEIVNADGTTDYADPEWAGKGDVFLLDGQVCFRYPEPGWEGPHCKIVWQRSANCYDGYFADDPYRQKRASLVSQMLGLESDVRFWRSEEPSTCPVEPTS